MIWIRDNLELKPRIDTVIFDVDGVLIDDITSYYSTVKSVVQYIVSELHGRPPAESKITDAHILAFKAAGGFNDDWELSYTLCGIILAGNDTPPLVDIATESAGRGMPWVRDNYFPTLELEFKLIERVCNEYYWGGERFQAQFGEQAIYNTGAGYVDAESALVPTDFFDQLSALDVVQFAVITGRSDIELEAGLETLGIAGTNHFAHTLDSTQIRKPNPAAMHLTMAALEPTQALYIGDTGDDLQLVLNYRESDEISAPCLVVIVAKPGQREHFAQAGADVVIDSAAELPEVIQLITQPGH